LNCSQTGRQEAALSFYDENLVIEVDALIYDTNGTDATVDWLFRTDAARIKLKRLYPSLSD